MFPAGLSGTRSCPACRACLPSPTRLRMVPSPASTASGMHLLPVCALLSSSCLVLMQSVDCRSQYYPTSNVQASSATDDLSDDAPPLSEPVDPVDSVHGSLVERHPRCMGDPLNPSSVEASERASEMRPRQPTRAYRGPEATPLLRKAASFTVFSSSSAPAAAARMNYDSLGRPDDHNAESQHVTHTPPTVVNEHRFKGKSTYGQTVSVVKSCFFKRY